MSARASTRAYVALAAAGGFRPLTRRSWALLVTSTLGALLIAVVFGNLEPALGALLRSRAQGDARLERRRRPDTDHRSAIMAARQAA